MLPIKINWVINLILDLIFLYKCWKNLQITITKNILSETSSIAKEKMICKDGFCSLPNQDEIPKQDANDMNLFDPI